MQQTKLRLPFDGEWFVFWGGDTPELNAHHSNVTQQYALDFLIQDKDGNRHSGDGSKNSDYHCFGRDILCPANGLVEESIDGIRDNHPGDTNPYFIPGNYVLIKHTDDEYSFLAHMQEGSVAVKKGDQIKAGTKIGLCGNSGNSGEPHLHYHLQNSFIYAKFDHDYERQYVASGIKTYFKDMLVNGRTKSDYSPIKDDKVQQP